MKALDIAPGLSLPLDAVTQTFGILAVRGARSSQEIQARVCSLLGGASARILEPLIDKYPKAIARDDLAAAAGYGNLNSKGFTNAIGRLRTLGFIDYPERGTVAATSILFLERSR